MAIWVPWFFQGSPLLALKGNLNLVAPNHSLSLLAFLGFSGGFHLTQQKLAFSRGSEDSPAKEDGGRPPGKRRASHIGPPCLKTRRPFRPWPARSSSASPPSPRRGRWERDFSDRERERQTDRIRQTETEKPMRPRFFFFFLVLDLRLQLSSTGPVPANGPWANGPSRCAKITAA